MIVSMAGELGMFATSLTYHDVLEILRTCSEIEIENCTPDFFREFVVRRLIDSPQLAKTVRGMDEESVHLLCHVVQQIQVICRHMAGRR